LRVAGIAVDMPSPNRPAARLVVVNESGGTKTVEVHEDYPSVKTEIAEQLHDQAEAVRSRLRGLNVDRVVVRRADTARVPSNNEGPRRRLLAEGALTSAARSVVVDTRIGTGKQTGEWHGTSKGEVDDESKQLLDAANLNRRYVEATSAALAGLKLP
jgi:hypothetical protein